MLDLGSLLLSGEGHKTKRTATVVLVPPVLVS